MNQPVTGATPSRAFLHAINAAVIITASGESATVIARAEYAAAENSYYLRYKAADGRAVEAWWAESALTAASTLAEAQAELAKRLDKLSETHNAALRTALADDTSSDTASTPPAIGQPWPGQGGIYAGIARGEDGQPDGHLIVSTITGNHLMWNDAIAFAKATVTIDGVTFTDFQAPSRIEAALCHTNLKDEFGGKGVYWTRVHTVWNDARSAWAQGFLNGSQHWLSKDGELRVRPVRRIAVNPSSLQSFENAGA